MSKHFEDARYYLGRAADHAKAGVKEELEPVEARVRELVGRETEPDPSRLDRLEADLAEVREAVAERAAGGADEPAGRDRDAAPHRGARTTSRRDRDRCERDVAGDATEGDDRRRGHGGSLTGEVAANADAALAEAAAMETGSDDDGDDRSLAERIRRLL